MISPDNARQALRHAMKSGAEEAEVFFIEGRTVSIDIKGTSIELARENLASGLGIRAIIRGAVGFASTNIPAKVKEAAEYAVTAAKVRASDPDWKSLPDRKEFPAVEGIYDDEVADIGLETCLDCALSLVGGVSQVRDAYPTQGSFSCSRSTQLILNSHGVEIQDEETGVEAAIEAAVSGSELSTALDFSVSRHNDIDFRELGASAAGLAVSSQGGRRFEAADVPVILKPMAAADLLENVFLPSLSAENVQKARSLLSGRMGEEIAPAELSIIDDGIVPSGMGTSRADDEGTPSQRTELVSRGVLKGFLHNSYTAGKDDVASTGNGVRLSYLTTPAVGIRNLLVEYPESDLIAETSRGIVVNTLIGAHTANAISGDFSVEARNAFYIENGELANPIKSVMLSGNIFDLVKKIDGAGKDKKAVGNIITPSLRFGSMRVLG